jgi:hypothetical protein
VILLELSIPFPRALCEKLCARCTESIQQLIHARESAALGKEFAANPLFDFLNKLTEIEPFLIFRRHYFLKHII